MARRAVARPAGGGSKPILDQTHVSTKRQEPAPVECPGGCSHTEAEHRAFDDGLRVGEQGGEERIPGWVRGEMAREGWLAGYAVGRRNASEEKGERHGFVDLVTETLPGGVVARWWANAGARPLVVVDALRIASGAGIPRGSIVFLEPGEETTEAALDQAERTAVEMGAVRVHRGPVRERGMGGAPEAPAGPAAAAVGLREAVDLAAEKLPADVREGARRRADEFLSVEKV